MFAQLLVGIYFIVTGVAEYFTKKPNWFVSSRRIERVSTENVSIYLRKVGKVHIFLGMFIATMGQIEQWLKPELSIFITTYIVIGFGCIGMVSYLHKKYEKNRTSESS